MKNDRYWAKRAEKRMYGYQKRADEAANDVAKAYAKATNEINAEIRRIFDTYRLNHGLTEAEARRLLNKLPDNARLADLKAVVKKIPDPETRQELLEQIDASAYAYRMKRFERLQQDIDSKTQELAAFEQKTDKAHLIDTMQDAYDRAAYDVQKGVGIAFPFTEMPLSRIEEILANNWSGRLFSVRIWGRANDLNQTIKQELLTGFMTGRSYRKTAQAIQNDMAVGAMEARRLVRTESTYVACMVELEAAKAMGVKKLKFVATLDMRTSAICQAHDGNLIDVDKAAPGETIPPLHPWCRSTTINVIDEALMKDWKRLARDPETGKTYEVPADMTYAEWKKSVDEKRDTGKLDASQKAVQANKKALQNGEKRGIMSITKTAEASDVHYVGRIDTDIYKCVTKDIKTDEVIITDERIAHIKERHPNDYEKYCAYMKEAVVNPEYIIEANKLNSALVLKSFSEKDVCFKTVVRLVTSSDNRDFKNSVITFMKIDDKEWNRLLRNKKILYKSE